MRSLVLVLRRTTFACQVQLDEYETIKLVNYIRKEVREGRDPRPALGAFSGAVSGAPWAAEEFLIPVLIGDPLMFFEFEDDAPVSAPPVAVLGGTSTAPTDVVRGRGLPRLALLQRAAWPTAHDEVFLWQNAELERLRFENDSLRAVLADLSSAALPTELLEEMTSLHVSAEAAPASAQPKMDEAGSSGANKDRKEVDAAYFDSYRCVLSLRSMCLFASSTRAVSLSAVIWGSTGRCSGMSRGPNPTARHSRTTHRCSMTA